MIANVIARFIQELKRLLVELPRKARLFCSSSLIREGIGITLLAFFSKAINFVAGAFAAQCVGASNFGVTGVITAWTAQASLLFNGGFDAVVSRETAQNPTASRELLASVVTFRLLVVSIVSLLWVVATYVLIPTEQWAVWQLGILAMLSNALNLVYLFQGLGKLPTLNLVTAAASILTALLYSTFSSPMPLGSDLLVGVGINALTTVALWRIAINLAPSSTPLRLNLRHIPRLFRASWKYWVIAAAQFAYTNFQLLILSAAAPEQELGAYRSALLIAGALEVIFGGFYNLLLPRFVNWKNAGEEAFRARRRKMLLLFVIIGIVPTVGLVSFSSLVYETFFSAEFVSGAVPLAFLAFAKFLNFVGQIYAHTLVVNEQDADLMKGCLIGSLASVILSMLLVGKLGIVAAALATLFGEGVITIFYIWFSIKSSRQNLFRVSG